MADMRARLKERLARREPVTGVLLDYPATALAHLLAGQFDFVFVDCEHGGPDIERVLDLALAIRAGGGVALLRPWMKDAGLLRRYLDCGIDGLVVPEVDAGGELDAAWSAVDGAAPPGRESLVLLAVVETRAGVENAAAIAAHGRVDGLVVGPADLAVSYGFPRREGQGNVREQALSVLDIARSAGRSAGVPVGRYDHGDVVKAGGNIFIHSVRSMLLDGIAAAKATLNR